jgi:hypothetical protein
MRCHVQLLELMLLLSRVASQPGSKFVIAMVAFYFLCCLFV